MLVNNQNSNDTVDQVAQHRCFACLTGLDTSKRDCAIRRLLAEGIAEDTLRAIHPSVKTAH